MKVTHLIATRVLHVWRRCLSWSLLMVFSIGCAGAISHETQHFIMLVVDTLNIILFKSRDIANPCLEQLL